MFVSSFQTTMPLSTQSQADDDYVLVASMDNARNLSNILKAIAFKDHAIFSATPNGLKVTVEDSKCLQANAFIQVCWLLICNSYIMQRVSSEIWIKFETTEYWFAPFFSPGESIHFHAAWSNKYVMFLFQAEIFQEFTIKEDLVGFQVNLTVLLDCLNIFGGSSVPGKDRDKTCLDCEQKENQLTWFDYLNTVLHFTVF